LGKCPDPLIIGAGKTEDAFETSTDRQPEVADSIELDNDDGIPGEHRTAQVLGEASRIDGIVAEYGSPT
jgi:hypothetical protein